MSSRIEQLQTVLEKLHAMGVLEQHLGLYTRTYTDAEGKKQTTNKEELEQYRTHAKVILATFQMGQEALDIPRLDAGMNLAPTSDGLQMIGRIARIFEGKPTPIWYVPKDLNCATIYRTYKSLMKSFAALPHVSFPKGV